MGPRGVTLSDEEYARQLQEEYDRESLRITMSLSRGQQHELNPHLALSSTEQRESQQQLFPFASAPPQQHTSAEDDVWSVRAISPSRSSEHDGEITNNQNSNASSMNDEEMARRLQFQQTFSNEASSRDLQQLQQDEQLARQLQLMEDQRGVAAIQSATPPPQPPPKSCFQQARRVICWSILVVVIAVSALLLFSFFSGQKLFVPNNGGGIGIGGIPNIYDPYKGTGGTMPTSKWETPGDVGLQITVYNALSSDWYPFFTEALQNWAFGHTPTSLLLFTQQVTTDSSCSSVSNVIKVCNGDYGDTGWKGINEAMVTSNGWITESTARMNDYYLSSASEGEKLYTMCHETGHAWGLNHQGISGFFFLPFTQYKIHFMFFHILFDSVFSLFFWKDENFYNKDLGSCMDYVPDPQNNQKPNAKDFEILYDLYGYIPNGTSTASMYSGRQLGRRRQQQLSQKENMESTLLSERPLFISFAERSSDPNRPHPPWRLLKRTKGTEVHVLELHNGFRMISHVMLA